MASGVITGTTSNKYIDSKIEWSSTSSVTTNKSTVTAKLYYKRNNTGYTTSGTGTFTINIGGTSTSKTHSISITANGWTLAVEGTATIAHNDDGKKSITISASGSIPVASLTSTTCSGTATLDTIARASVPTLSASSVVMLSSVTINTNRKSSSFTHDLTYNFNGYKGTIATGVGASYSWTVPDLVSKISGKSSGTCTIYCKTKNGSTVIGTKSVTLTLTIPEKSVPTASASTVQMGKSVTINTNRKSSGYTHTITYAIGSTSGTISSGVGVSKPWTPPKNLASYTNNKTSATCTITCKTYNGTLLVGSATTDITLTVPNATVPTLSASTVALGSEITISLPKEAEVYTHDLAYSLVGYGTSTVVASGNLTTTGTSAPYSWTVPLSLASKIPKYTKGTITITCKTRFAYTTTVVDTKTASFTVTVPNNSTTKPKFTMTLTPVHSLSSAFNGVFVQGKSKLKVSYTASSDYSTIASCETKILGVTGKTNPFTSSLLNSAGTVTIVGKVTDARGYYTEKTSTISVISYSRPRIIPGDGQNKIICNRCNSDGTIDAGGVWLLIKIGRKFSKVVSGSQKNFCKLSYQWKTDAQGDSEYSDPVELLSKTASSDYVSEKLNGIVTSNTTAYNIRLIAEDDVGDRDTVTITVPTAFVTWHSPPGGHGFTLGGYHDPSKYNVFDCIFNAEFEGNVYGRVLGLGKLPPVPEGADFNDYKDFGAYAVVTNSISKTIANIPVQKAGTLRVWSATGNGDTVGNYVYMIQEYVAYDNSATYRRFVVLETNVWVYKPWYAVGGIDSVLEQGTTGIWTYRKWNSGIAECWGRVAIETPIATVPDASVGENFFVGNTTFGKNAYPFSFTSSPLVQFSLSYATSNFTYPVLKQYSEYFSETPEYWIASPYKVTGTGNYSGCYYVTGKWK